MSFSEENVPPYEEVPLEKWGPKEFNECRDIATQARPEGDAERRRWLRAKMHLVWAYRSGYGTEPDSRRHFEILLQVAELDAGAELGAKWLLARAFKEGIGTVSDPQSYFTWMKQAALEGDPEAMFSLAEAYRSGDGVAPDEDQYFYWRQKMAEQGSPFAVMELAHAFKTGIGTPQSNDEFFKSAIRAMELAKEAMSADKIDENLASEDLPRAILLVARAYQEGTGTAKCDVTYFKYLSEAVDAVNYAIELEKAKEPPRVKEVQFSLAPILCEFALAHLEGYGTVKSPTKAFMYMKEAAGAGDPKGMLRLATLYESGLGTSRNPSSAFHWRKKAAELNDPTAMYETAITYGTRTGGSEDPVEFHRWARDAVRTGHNKAFMALSLAELHLKGLITPRKISNVLDLFDSLRREVQEIKSGHTLAKNEAPDGVAHFTTLETLHSMLPAPTTSSFSLTRGDANFLRLYNLAYVNDPQEGKILLVGDDDEAITIQEFFPGSLLGAHEITERRYSETIPLSGLAFSVYVGSFTLRSDRLDLWRAYGQDGTGFCIVTPIQSFLRYTGTADQAFAGFAASEANDPDIPMTLYRVEYGKTKIASTRLRLNKYLKEISAARDRVAKAALDQQAVRSQIDLTVRAILSDVLYLYKHAEYKNEEEVRMLAPFAISARPVTADERSPAHLFVRTQPFLFAPDSKIIIGPKVRQPEAVRLELKHRLDRNGHSGVDVVPSEIQYR